MSVIIKAGEKSPVIRQEKDKSVRKGVQKGEDGRRIIIWEIPDTQTACKR